MLHQFPDDTFTVKKIIGIGDIEILPGADGAR